MWSEDGGTPQRRVAALEAVRELFRWGGPGLEGSTVTEQVTRGPSLTPGDEWKDEGGAELSNLRDRRCRWFEAEQPTLYICELAANKGALECGER